MLPIKAGVIRYDEKTLLKELIKVGVESGVLTKDDFDDFALGIEDELRGEALDFVDFHQVIGGRVQDADPGKFVLGRGGFPFGFGVAAGDADDFQLVLMPGIGSFHIGKAFDAPGAPAAPEVDHDIFALQRREREHGSVRFHRGEIGSLDALLDGLGKACG